MKKRTDLSIREVISTNPQFLQVMLEEAQEIVVHEKEKMLKQRLPLPLAYTDFKNLFRSFGTICLHSRNQNRSFVIDSDNIPMIEQLYLYATGNLSFEGDLMLQGKYGCGKTLILETYSLLHNHLFGNTI